MVKLIYMYIFSEDNFLSVRLNIKKRYIYIYVYNSNALEIFMRNSLDIAEYI